MDDLEKAVIMSAYQWRGYMSGDDPTLKYDATEALVDAIDDWEEARMNAAKSFTRKPMIYDPSVDDKYSDLPLGDSVISGYDGNSSHLSKFEYIEYQSNDDANADRINAEVYKRSTSRGEEMD